MQRETRTTVTKLKQNFISITVIILLMAVGCSAEFIELNNVESIIDSTPFEIAEQGVAASQGVSNNHDKLVNKFYKRLQKENIDSILALFTDDVEFFFNGTSGTVPLAGSYEGKAEVRDFLTEYSERINIESLDLQYNVNFGNMISSHINIVAHITETNKTINLEFVYLFEIDKNKIQKISVYYDTYNLWRAFSNDGDQYITDIKFIHDDYTVMNSVNYNVHDLTMKLYKDFREGNLPAALAALNEDMEVAFKGAEGVVPMVGRFDGIDGFVDFAYKFQIEMIFQNFDLVLVDGNRVDVFLYESYRVIPTGKVFVIYILNSFKLDENGKFLNFESYNETKEVYDNFLP